MLIGLVVAVLVFALLVLLMLDRMVLGRISFLSHEVSERTETLDFSRQIPEGGSDEIGTLTSSVNGMISAVYQVMSATGMGR